MLRLSPRSLRTALATLIVLIALGGCGTTPTETVIDSELPPLMARIEAPLAIDGKAEGYPAPPLVVAGVEVHLAHDGSAVYAHARAEAQGWIAVGFNQAGRGMDGANMMLGLVNDAGQSVVRNDIGRGTTHSELSESGIIDAVVLQDGDALVLEFSYPMAFAEGAGFRLGGLESGQMYSLITARSGRSPDPSRIHSDRGQMDFSVE